VIIVVASFGVSTVVEQSVPRREAGAAGKVERACAGGLGAVFCLRDHGLFKRSK